MSHGDHPPIRIGPAADAAAVVAVAVHGRDRSPDDMVDQLVGPLGTTDVCWVLPVAEGACWYPNGFAAPIASNQPDLDEALTTLSNIEHGLAVDPRRLLWVGFSQGACLATEHVARSGVRYGGLAALTGARIGTADERPPVAGTLAGMPAYFSVGDPDEWIGVDAVTATAAEFRDAGAAVTIEVFPGRDHAIGIAEVEWVAAMLDAIRS